MNRRKNIREKLKEKGFDFDHGYVVLEVCNPKEANFAADVETRLIGCIQRAVNQ